MRVLIPVFLSLTLAVGVALSSRSVAGGGEGSRAVVDPEIRGIRDDLAPMIAAAQDKYRVPGLSLVLVRGGQTLWLEGFGHADRAAGVPAGPDTVFRAGSLAKPFTSLAVLQLAEAGELDIDQPLAGYLPEFSIRSRFDATAQPITVRSVLSHHSGLPTDLNKGKWTNQAYTTVATAMREEYTAFPPFLVYSYSNIGYTLLGHMVEKVSGIPFPEYMADRVFAPLGMNESGFGPDRVPEGRLAKGYRGGRELVLLPMRDLPAHGLYTSASDLGAFMRMVLAGGTRDGKRIVASETLEEMLEPQNADVPLDLEVVNGLGWFLDEDSIPGGCGRVVRHGGTTLAFAGELILLPDRQLGIAVLANADGSRPIVARLAEEILSRFLAGMDGPAPATGFLADLKKEMEGETLAEIEGNYATDFGLISITPENAKVCACIVDKSYNLIPYPNGWFGVDRKAMGDMPRGIRPLANLLLQTRVIDGREVVVAKKGEKISVLGEKVPDTPVPQAWLARVGKYELLNPDDGFPLTDPQIKLRDGQLCMSYRLPALSPKIIQVPIRPISDTEAIILGLGRTRGETLRVIQDDGEERLRYSGFLGRKLVEGD